jgi:hypothetical protein
MDLISTDMVERAVLRQLMNAQAAPRVPPRRPETLKVCSSLS